MANWAKFTVAFGFFFVTVFYLSYVRVYGPLLTGLGRLPFAIGVLPAAGTAIALTRRFGRRAVGIAGLLALTMSFLIGMALSIDSPYWVFAIVMAVFGLGIGMSGPPATEAIIESLPVAKQGVASALNDVLREFGAAIGIASVGAAFNSAYRGSLANVDDISASTLAAVRDTPRPPRHWLPRSAMARPDCSTM